MRKCLRQPIITAAKQGDVDTLRGILAHGGNPNESTCYGLSTVHYASFYAQPEALRLLILAQGDVNRRSLIGITPLKIALRAGAMKATKGAAAETVALLLEAGADPNIGTETGPFPHSLFRLVGRANNADQRSTTDALVNGAWTLENSAFGAAYKQAAVPAAVCQYMDQVQSLVDTFVSAKGMAPSSPADAAQAYVSQLRVDSPADDVAEIAETMWTSAHTLEVADGNYEFCQILNWALWQDTCSTEVSTILRTLNLFCVGRASLDRALLMKDPPNKLYRGGGFHPACRTFFKVGLRFRAPPVLPTSSTRITAEYFAHRSSLPEKILWKFLCPGLCTHVNHIVRRAAGVPEEDEWLFTAYSVFEVRSVKWGVGSNMHKIKLEVCTDNSKESMQLPCSPWA